MLDPLPISKSENNGEKQNQLCQSGVLKKDNHSEWVAPAFIIPKKDGSVRFISASRKLEQKN